MAIRGSHTCSFGYSYHLCFFLKQRRKKALSYEILSQTPLLSVKEEVKGKVEILFDKKPVQQVHLVEIRLVNSGNVPIKAEEFERPINLSFGEEAQIFTAEVAETTPKSLRAKVVIEKKIVVLQPTLLNEGDSIKLKMLVAKFAKVNLDGRIVGVKEISEFIEKKTRYMALTIMGLILNLGGLLVVLSTPTSAPPTQKIIGYAMGIVGFALAVYYLRKW